MIGLPHGEVFLVDYTPEWDVEYENESADIKELAGHYIKEIHHIGSTSVPDLKAKPIIDIAVVLFSYNDGFRCIDPLKSIGYKHRIIPELPERHYFSKGNLRTHQIHMYGPDSRYFHAQIIFRDKLRSSPEILREYQKLKQDLVRKNGNNKLAYADAKTTFIKSILRESKWMKAQRVAPK
jgi:GrpB-like predicted nucleotidyltransferase (UPF0157 family)